MIAAFLLAAIAIDLALVDLAARPSGLSPAAGPVHLSLHDPWIPLVTLAILSGALVMACWQTRARNWSLVVPPLVACAAGLLLTRHAETMFPLGDIALIELYVRNALAGRLLVGPYSRFGWHHPGPLYLYILAGPYAAAGRTTASLGAGAALINAASVALMVCIARRSCGARASVMLLIGTALYVCAVPGILVSPWNPHIVILPMFAMMAASGAAMAGDHVMLPIAAALASLIVQADAALAPVALAVSASALAGYVRTTGFVDRGRTLKSLNVTALVLAGLWALPVAEQVTHAPGNLTLLWRFFLSGHQQGQTWRSALSTWTVMQTTLLGFHLPLAQGGVFQARVEAEQIVFEALTIAALILFGWRARRSNRALSCLALVCLIALAAALWSITRIQGEIIDHEVFWISGLGAFCFYVAAIEVGELVFASFRRRFQLAGRWPGLAHAGAFALVLGVAFAQLDRARQGRLPVTTNNPVVARLAGSVRQYLEDVRADKPLVRIGENDWGFTAGVLLELDRRGIPFAVEPAWMPMFPQSFASNGGEDAEVAFGNGDEHAAREKIAGETDIASFAPLYVDGLPVRKK